MSMYARIADACERARAHVPKRLDGDLKVAAAHFRTLVSSPADSAEDAAGVAERLEQHATDADSFDRTMHDTLLYRRAAALLRSSSAAVAEAKKNMAVANAIAENSAAIVEKAVNKEREECASICEAHEDECLSPGYGEIEDAQADTCTEIARRIRARSARADGDR